MKAQTQLTRSSLYSVAPGYVKLSNSIYSANPNARVIDPVWHAGCDVMPLGDDVHLSRK